MSVLVIPAKSRGVSDIYYQYTESQKQSLPTF